MFGVFAVLLLFLLGHTAASQVPSNWDPDDPGTFEGDLLAQAPWDPDELAERGGTAADEHETDVPISRQLTVPGESHTALSILYSSTGGSTWTLKTNWMVGDPCTAAWYVIQTVPCSLFDAIS